MTTRKAAAEAVSSVPASRGSEPDVVIVQQPDAKRLAYSLPICVVCEIDVRKHGPGYRCTNGCCPECHRQFCTPGGITEPGHGINIERARAFIADGVRP